MADREADIYEMFVEAPGPESAADWLEHGQHDRVIAKGKTLRLHIESAATVIGASKPLARSLPRRRR